ncbi:MAG: peptidylprolyl isomerase [Clostridia bacterium]|nr:peptidylprolyl isomerase [Clostridia bacterium]
MKKALKLLALILCAALLMTVFPGCGGQTAQNVIDDSDEETDLTPYMDSPYPIAVIKIKGYGTMIAELYPDIAPETVKNFISLSNSGFYDGLIFHRVIKNFMIQGGDPNGNGSGGPGYTIKGEFTANGFENNLKHERGVLSMARRSNQRVNPDPLMDSAGSQFFIMHVNYPSLNGLYASFGKVIKGIEIVDEIANVKTNSSDKPLTDVVIKSIRVETKGVTYDEPTKLK